MSQIPMEQPAGKAFTQTPNGAKYFQQQYANAQGQPQQPPAQQPPQGQQQPAQPQGQPQGQSQQPMQVMAPPPRPQQRGILPQPKTYAPQPNQPQEQPGPTNTAPEPQAAPPAYDMQLQKQLEAERQMFAQREQQWQQWAEQQNQQLAAAEAARVELDKLKNREALAQKLASNETFAELQSVDAEDARKIINLTAEAFQEPLNTAADQLKQMQAQQAQTQQYIAQQMAAMQSQRVRDELLSAHPDFFQLYDHNQAFRQFLNERDGLSFQTREQRAIAEYQAGNAPYLIDLINQFKGVAPKVNDIKTVAPVQVANAAAPYQQPVQQPQYTLADLNYFMQTGQISPDQYREELNKLRAAQPV